MNDEEMQQYYEQQKALEQSTTGGYVPNTPLANHHQHLQNVAMDEIDNRKLISSISKRLLGYIYDDDNDKWVKEGNALMSEEGVRDIMSHLGSHGDKNSIMGQLRSETFDQLAKAIRNNIIDWIAANEERYCIDKSKRSLILDIIFNPILFVLTRAEGADEKKYRSGILSVVQQGGDRVPQRGFFGMFSKRN